MPKKKKEEGWKEQFCKGDIVSVCFSGRVLRVGKLTGSLLLKLGVSTIEVKPDEDDLDLVMIEKDEYTRIRERNLGLR